MPMFPHAHSIQISGGQFNDVSGDQVNYYDNSKTDIRDAFNTHNNNFNNAFNDNSSRGSSTSPYSTASSPGFRGGRESPFGPGFPFNNPEKRSHSPFGRPSAPHRETEPALAGRTRSPFDKTGLHPSSATTAKAERAAERAASAFPTSGSSRASSSSNISGSFNTNSKNISDAYNDYSVQTNNYNNYSNKNVTDSHDDNRDYSKNNMDQSYRDNRDQSTHDSFNRSSNRNEDRSTTNNQDYRNQSRPVDHSQHTSNDNRRYEDNRKSDNRKYENQDDNRTFSDSRRYETRNDVRTENRNYDSHNDNRQFDNSSYDSHNRTYDNRQSDSHNRSSVHNGASTNTTNTDNSAVNHNNVSGGLTNSGVISPNPSRGKKGNNPFSNYVASPPAERKTREDNDFASNPHSERTSRSVTPKTATPRPNERRRSGSFEGRRIEAASPRQSSQERQPRARAPSQDALSYTDGSPSRSYLGLPVENPAISQSPDRMRTSPQPLSSHQDLPAESSSSSSPSPSQAQPEQQQVDVKQPSHANTLDNVTGMLNHLVVTPETRTNTINSVTGVVGGLAVETSGQQEEPTSDVASDTSPSGKEKTRKRDRFKNMFSSHKKDKEPKATKVMS